MDEAVVVQVGESGNDIPESSSENAGLETGCSGDLCEHIACGCVLGDECEGGGGGGGGGRDVCGEDTVERGDVGMLEKHVQGDLATDGGADLGRRDDLDGEGGGGAGGAVDGTGRAGAEDLVQLVAVDGERGWHGGGREVKCVGAGGKVRLSEGIV